jgi:riboflavin kinase / FMN adenylyltransferase
MHLHRDFARPSFNAASSPPSSARLNPEREHDCDAGGNLGLDTRGGVVTLGNFDGVHLGHQALLAALRRLANHGLGHALDTHVVTFSPHPRDYFAAQGRGAAALAIGSVRDRLARLAAAGVDHVHLLRFNHALASLPATDFVQQVLVRACRARQVVVGRDVRFGAQRAGDLTLLRALGAAHGFTVQVLDEVLDDDALRISSSAVRQALRSGDIPAANALLGYDYALSGRVIHGRKLGRTLGCPTLNLVPRMAHPALRGICVVAVDGLADASGTIRRHWGVASLGLRPTVEQTTRFSLEVHVFDWAGDAYGRRVTVTFLHKLRDEAAYVDLPTLEVAIAKDMVDARAWLGLSGYLTQANN